MTEIRMPRLSDSMERGLVLQWLAQDGQSVAVGDELLEIETDKATVTYAAEAEGVLVIVVPAGESVAAGEVIARLRAGEEVAEPGAAAAEPARGEEAAVTVAATATNGDARRAEPEGAVLERGLATPVARRLAALHGVALDALTGTGPRGRITKADVLSAADVVAPAPRASRPAVGALDARPGNVSKGAGIRELSRTQQLIARRMSEAKATIPHFQVQTEVAMDRANALRHELKEAVAQPDPAPSINDLIVCASALALGGHPLANGSYRDGRFELHDAVNVGIAVATDDALIVPTVFDADHKSLLEIAADSKRLTARVRSGEITPPEVSGATFTVSNLGMYGMTAITPVINPPQAAILGVGTIRDTLARDPDTGEIVDRKLLTLTLSCDHRILYGADAARFLAEIKDLLEAPLRLLL